MHFLSFVLLSLLQVACVIHAIRRDYSFGYILTILMFPLVGAIVYLITEVIPRVYEQITYKKAQITNKRLFLKKGKTLETLQVKAHTTPSFENQYEYIVGLIEHQKPKEALEVIDKLQQGIYADSIELFQCREKIAKYL